MHNTDIFNYICALKILSTQSSLVLGYRCYLQWKKGCMKLFSNEIPQTIGAGFLNGGSIRAINPLDYFQWYNLEKQRNSTFFSWKKVGVVLTVWKFFHIHLSKIIVIQVHFLCEIGRLKKYSKWLFKSRLLQIFLKFLIDMLITDFAKLTPLLILSHLLDSQRLFQDNVLG